MRRSLTLLPVVCLLLPACIGVPQPDPPSFNPRSVDTSVGRNTTIEVIAPPGTVQPATGEVAIWDVDQTESDPLVLRVNPDGSLDTFEVVGPTLRVQARRADQRDVPWDFVFDATRDTLDLLEPVSACLQLRRDVEVGAAQVGRVVEASVDIVNECADATTLTVAARRPSDFSVEAAPSRIEAGARASVRVRFVPSDLGLREELLFVEITAPAAERRIVTVFGEGLP